MLWLYLVCCLFTKLRDIGGHGRRLLWLLLSLCLLFLLIVGIERKTMPRNPQRPRKDSDPEQLKRFKDMAREVEVDERPEAFDRAFKKVIRPKPARQP